MEIKIEEAADELPRNAGEAKRRVYKPIESSLSHATKPTAIAVQMHSFPDTIFFEHKVSYQDMRNQFLSIYLMEQGSTPNHAPQVVSVYRIDLVLLAIGPIHHDIQLQRANSGIFSSGSAFAARLNVDIKFVQT